MLRSNRGQDLTAVAAAWRRSRARARRAAALALCCAAACETPPVAWGEPHRSAMPESGAQLPPGAVAAVTAAGEVDAAPDPATPLPPDAVGRQCVSSVRLTHGVAASGAPETYAAWWSVRPDSSALLLAARSDDAGRSWAQTFAVDSVDRSARGCARPAPAVTADSVTGYVHVVYFMEAPEGPGLFFSHLMDPRAQFEPATVIVYGERPSAASVASRGDTVAVVYETPNGTRPRIELALSYSSGHLFERRALPVSDGNAVATAPTVTLDGQRLAVGWVERPAAGEGRAALVVRTGRLR
jgi:hypothetical protein